MKYVYLLRAGKGYYKIGHATNMVKRVKSHQTSNAERVEIVAAKLTTDAAAFEVSLHRLLEKERLNGGREWFKLTDEQAIELAILINESPTDFDVSMSEVESLRVRLDQVGLMHAEINGKFDTLLEQVRRSETRRRSSNFVPSDADNQKADMNELREQQKQTQDKALLSRAIEIVGAEGKASTSLLQRRLSIGYGRAARIIEQMEELGVIGPLDGIHREVLDIHNRAVEIAHSRIGI